MKAIIKEDLQKHCGYPIACDRNTVIVAICMIEDPGDGRVQLWFFDKDISGTTWQGIEALDFKRLVAEGIIVLYNDNEI